MEPEEVVVEEAVPDNDGIEPFDWKHEVPKLSKAPKAENPELRETDWIPPYQVRGRLSQARNDIRHTAARAGVDHYRRSTIEHVLNMGELGNALAFGRLLWLR
jgi:hypothetical protein